MYRIEYIIKDENNKTVGALVNTGISKITISVYDIISRNLKFDNAIVCRNGVIKDKNGSLPIYVKSNNKNKIITIYHGSQNKVVKLQYGLGEDNNDYGRGFYTTQNKELAKEWAVGTHKDLGYLHTYEINLDGLKIFNFNNVGVL